jgi:transcriptional regulator with XRE-family HTH domain
VAVTASVVIGENLRRLRADLGLTQEDIAHRAEMHPTKMTIYECGYRMPAVLTVVKLAASLSATPDDVLRGLSWAPGVYEHGRYVIGEERA